MRVLITGANGFIGSQLTPFLNSKGYTLVPTGNFELRSVPGFKVVESIDLNTDWKELLREVDAVVHLAARVHVMQESAGDPLMKFRRVNVEGTESLARQAAEMGVRLFIFMSSIKVNGEETEGKPFQSTDPPNPRDPYAISKLEAEQILRQIESQTNMEVCIIRPPLVHGPGVKGNLATLVRLVRLGIPLPFGAVKNSRSLVGVSNLCSLIARCLTHPASRGATFLVSDGFDISIPYLIRELGRQVGRPTLLFPLPVSALHGLMRFFGKQEGFRRLCSSLQVDMTLTCQSLEWAPPVPLQEGLKEMLTNLEWRSKR
jgi:nucleoside-diphosphate-sugar epimerase